MLDNIFTSERSPLTEALRIHGICSTPACDQPIAQWCTRCGAKMCSRHIRLVQLAPDYQTATLCNHCQQKCNVVEDPATIILRRPDFDPTEEQASEGHALWWMAMSLRRYFILLATEAPQTLLERELHMLARRHIMLTGARERAQIAASVEAASEAATEETPQ